MDRALRETFYAQPEVKRILELIGRVSIHWNEIELVWYLIYTCLLHEPPRTKIDAVFRQFDTGAHQRKFIATLADQIWPKTEEVDSPYRVRICQLMARSHDLAGERNNVLHGDYFFSIEEGRGIELAISASGEFRKKPNKLAGKRVADELQRMADEMLQLVADLDEFRLILLQEFLPKDERVRPFSPEILASMPPDVRKLLPREKRERIVIGPHGVVRVKC